ncbi:hypothetical protein [Dyella japonica]|uniref:Uncharacterized protein n=1 Tax=Dyella japonica DSM 16301 TaxID=1440762 RepID=A0A0G9H6I0_9GAMM|nr:hypothetical protein [Dyella japonica]KLD65445.1 hypothetical protein Y882_02695 [Dyella japonica DSM 16301]
MASTYGHRWASVCGDSPEHPTPGPLAGQLTDAGKVWAHELRGITGAEMRAALDRMSQVHIDFAPTAPEFRLLCLNVPPLSMVMLALDKGDEYGADVSAFCRLVWQFIRNRWGLDRLPELAREKAIAAAYKLAVRHRLALGELPPAPVALLESVKPAKPVRAAADFAAPFLEQCRQMINGRGDA